MKKETALAKMMAGTGSESVKMAAAWLICEEWKKNGGEIDPEAKRIIDEI